MDEESKAIWLQNLTAGCTKANRRSRQPGPSRLENGAADGMNGGAWNLPADRTRQEHGQTDERT